MAKNDITGDSIFSKKNNKNYEDNYDLIYKKKKPIRDPEWNEDRMDVIGSNGNEGLHYNDNETQKIVDDLTNHSFDE